ncbi:MAG: hypothetical protein JW793_02090, partial [Acidobacteria bacterium]|nr:hypothetical protein [Acidobacteriota bacterium]
MGNNGKGIGVRRRDFLKATTFAGMAAALPAAGLAAQNASIGSRPSPAGKQRNLLFSSDDPGKFGKLMESIRSVREFDFQVTPIKIDFQKLEESAAEIRRHDADILVLNLPGAGITSARIAHHIDTLDIPVIVIPSSLDLIMLDADVVASLRRKSVNSMLANSESDVLEMVRVMAAPRILEGKKALIFGRPFDSSSVPVPHLNEDYIYRHTGVRLEYRPISDLKPLLETVDEARALEDMQRWKKGAVEIV